MQNQNIEQQFLKELDDKLWKAADKLRNNLDAANYKHIVLGLIFLKYVSDAFEARQNELKILFQTNSYDNIYFMPREDYDSDEEYQQAINDELELLEYYQEKNVFWVPKAARWNTLKETAALPTGSVIWQDEKGQDVKLRSISWLVDNALDEIEKVQVVSLFPVKNSLKSMQKSDITTQLIRKSTSLFTVRRATPPPGNWQP